MANWISSAAGFWIDNASGTLTDISQYVNNNEQSGGTQLLDDTGLGDTIENFTGGIAAGTRLPLNGFLNSTTYAIFGPLLNQTSVTKTIQVKYFTGKYKYGEAWPTNVQITQAAKAIQVWSCELVAVNGLTTTSVAQV